MDRGVPKTHRWSGEKPIADAENNVPVKAARSLWAAFLCLSSCSSHEERARRLLSKAVAACGLQQAGIEFVGTNDDPKDARRRVGQVDQHLIYVFSQSLSSGRIECVDNVLKHSRISHAADNCGLTKRRVRNGSKAAISNFVQLDATISRAT